MHDMHTKLLEATMKMLVAVRICWFANVARLPCPGGDAVSCGTLVLMHRE